MLYTRVPFSPRSGSTATTCPGRNRPLAELKCSSRPRPKSRQWALLPNQGSVGNRKWEGHEIHQYHGLGSLASSLDYMEAPFLFKPGCPMSKSGMGRDREGTGDVVQAVECLPA